MSLTIKLGSNSQLLIFATFVLAVGKLLGMFALSWFWVFSPLWAPLALLGVYLIFALMFVILMFILEALGSSR